MEQIAEREALVRSYLLGELPEQVQEVVEVRLLNDPDYLDEVILVEDELAEDFVFGKLPDHQAEQVWHRFIDVPERRNKLKAVKAIEQYVSRVFSDYADHDEWDSALKEAEARRQRLSCLIANDWNGLKILVQIRSQAGGHPKLGSFEFSFEGALKELTDAGLVDRHNGNFTCTKFGIEILEQIERSLNVSLSL